MNAKVIGIAVLLLVLCVFLSIFTPGSFLQGNNIENLLRRTSMYGILGIGVAFVIITGGIDLSIGSLVCVAGCLLASLLHVDYSPFEIHDVSAVSANEKVITVSGKTSYEIGDQIRYYGGRRARKLVARVTAVKTDQLDDGTFGTKLTIDEQPSNDDFDGSVAKLVSVESFQEGAGNSSSDEAGFPEVVLGEALDDLAVRDAIWFIHPDKPLKRLRIVQATVANGKTSVVVNDTLGDFGVEWLAVPLERKQRTPIPIAITVVLAFALLLGLLHGWLITKLNLPSFIVTLCGLLIYRSVSRWLVDDQIMGFSNEYDDSLRLLGTGKWTIWEAADGGDSFGIPYPFFTLLFVAIAAIVFLNRTVWGRYMLALGRNEEAARYSGINTDRMTLVAYVISAGLAAVGGILFALDNNSIPPSSFGEVYELYAIAAAVLGGCSLRGGEGGIIGVVIGTAVMQTLYNLIVLVGISDKLELAVVGAVILLGVIADELVKRVAAKRRAVARARQAAEKS